MKKLASLLVAAVVALVAIVSVAAAGPTDPLFVNLTTEDAHRASMALAFSANQQERSHPVTVFLNDRAVLLAAKSQSARFAVQQKALAEMMAKGAQVYICPMCMKHYGMAETDRLDGVQVGNPDALGAALFRDGGKTLSW